MGIASSTEPAVRLRHANGWNEDQSRARLTVELLAAALDAILAEIAGEAFVLGPDGGVLYANPAGRARLAGDGEAAPPRPAAASQPFRRRVLKTADGPPGQASYLMFVPLPVRDRVTAATARRWSLTRRQTEVLARIVAGDFNKEIAGTLACSRRAVEHHVTAILRKTGTHSRAELVGRIFTDVTAIDE